MANCFVSHASMDRAQSELVHRALTAAGHRVFLDVDHDDGIRPAEDWEERLWRELDLADAIVFVNSLASQASLWCRDELQRAKRRSIPIFSVAVTDDVPPYALIGTKQGATGASFDERVASAVSDINALSIASWNPERSPYPGLAAFEPEDEAIFFGRTEDIAYLRRILGMDDPANGQRLLMMGPSGVGKSSLVRAGLLPSVRRHPGWRVVTPRLVPPNLHASVLDALREAGGGGTGSILDRSREIVRRLPHPARLLLVIDQAEDLLLPDVDVALRDRLVAELQTATASHSPVSTLVSFREDRLAEMKAVLPHFLESGLTTALVVNRMPTSRVTELVEGPARVHALTLDPGLAGRLQDDATSSDDRVHALPLIAFTLSEMYRITKERGDHRLTIRDYEEVGQFKGAISTAAVKTEAKIADVAALDSLLIKLVDVNEQGGVASRTLPASRLSPQEHTVAEILADDRLVTLSQDEQGEPIVRLVHDRLSSDWPRLSRLIDNRRDDLQMQARLERQAKEFSEGQRDVLPPEATKEARDWLALQPLNAPLESVRALVKESRRRHRRRRAIWQTTGAIVLTLAVVAGLFAAVSQRAKQRTKVLSLTATAQSYSTGGQPFAALAKAYESAEAGWNAEAERAMRQSVGELGSARHLGLKKPVEQLTFSPDGTIAALIDGAVLGWNPDLGTQSTQIENASDAVVTNFVYNRDGSRLAIEYADGQLSLWDRGTDRPALIDGVPKGTSLRGFSSDGSRLLVASQGLVATLNVLTGEWSTHPLDEGSELLATSADGSLAVTLLDATASVRDVKGAGTTAVRSFEAPGRPFDAAISEDDSRVALFYLDGTARIFDVATGSLEFDSNPKNEIDRSFALAFSPDQRMLALLRNDQAIEVVDVATGAVTFTTEAVTAVADVFFSPGGDWLAAVTAENQAFVWNTSTPVTLGLGTTRTDGRAGLAFDADGQRVAAAGAANDLLVYDLASLHPSTLRSDNRELRELVFSGDGSALASSDIALTVTVWDVRTGIERLIEPASSFTDIALDSSGATLVALESTTSRPVVWDLTTKEPIRSPTDGLRTDATADHVAVSPDGRQVAVGYEDGTTELLDRTTGVVRVLRPGSQRLVGLQFSDDGQRLLVAPSDVAPVIWVYKSGQILRSQRDGATHATTWVTADRGLSRVTFGTSSTDATTSVIVWEVRSGTAEPISGLDGATWAMSEDGTLLASSHPPAARRSDGSDLGLPDDIDQKELRSAVLDGFGNRIVLTTRDGTVRIWDPTQRHSRLLATNTGNQKLITFSPTGDMFATARSDGSIRLWNDSYLIDCPELWLRASAVLGRAPTSDAPRRC